VYFLIDRNNLDARNALHKFSEMLRYQLYEAGGDRIPVEKEIHYLRDYMDLQLMRKDEKYSVEFNCGEDVKDFSIEPLLLSPFVENAFKHISHFTDRTNFVKVDLSRSNGVFHFTVENSREEGVQTEAGSGGIGMVNVKRRLELLYPGKHELHIAETPENFRVNLNLHLS
jgi:LytS/YehU family sensor histidine kinase